MVFKRTSFLPTGDTTTIGEEAEASTIVAAKITTDEVAALIIEVVVAVDIEEDIIPGNRNRTSQAVLNLRNLFAQL